MNDPRPVGPPIPNWTEPARPDMAPMQGRYAHLEALDAERHAARLYRAFSDHDWVWDYMPIGPFASEAQFCQWVTGTVDQKDTLFYAIEDLDSGQFGGFASFLRIKPQSGSIEVGFIAMAPQLQRRRAATEALFLMMQWAFEAGYRRFEWKCDALNRPSRRAAERLGFSYEGVFRQATVVKGRNRDTAWYSIIDTEWPALAAAFDMWLAPGNFDAKGVQRERLSDLTQSLRGGGDLSL